MMTQSFTNEQPDPVLFDRDPERWQVTVTYRDATPTLNFFVEEIEEIQDAIEIGPDFNLIEEISIIYLLGD